MEKDTNIVSQLPEQEHLLQLQRQVDLVFICVTRWGWLKNKSYEDRDPKILKELETAESQLAETGVKFVRGGGWYNGLPSELQEALKKSGKWSGMSNL
ncbi:MAG TPA: hypothetical protein VJH67_03215 [Candidatus Paceibacterota bacterium]